MPTTRLDPRSLLARLSPRPRQAWERVAAAFESPWVAYPLLLALQLKVVWGVWAYRDVTLGDTTHYFARGWSWFTNWDVNIAWSPLYTAFYGSFLFVNPDPVWATFAHRLVIVLAAALLVLAVMRKLLPPAVAWLCAAWWAVLPIVFNTLYEVHLFAVIPVLGVWLLLLTARGPWRRAAALGLLAATTVLVRNELSVATAVLGLALAWYEWRRREEGRGRAGIVLAYATALGLAAGVVFLAYHASTVKYPQLSRWLRDKHTVNMAQVYAFGYQQRHPEWTANPWLECYPLMKETFGSRMPTLREMIAANPAAVREHFAWNFSLAPSGIQLLMFSLASGSVSPDYDAAVGAWLNSRLATRLTIPVLVVWAAGLVALWRDRRELWRDWLAPRALGWVGMFAVATVVPLVIATQRPRPSYLFAFLVLLIALTGMFFHAATYRWRLGERLRHALPALAVVVLLIAPRHFTRADATPTPVADEVRRLLPHRAELLRGPTRLVVANMGSGAYLCPTGVYRHPRDQLPDPASGQRAAVRYHQFADLLDAARPGESFGQLLDRFHVSHIYLDEWHLTTLAGRAPGFVSGDDPGWELVASGDMPGDRWRFYRRAE